MTALSQKELVGSLVQQADTALLAAVFYVIALGLYSLFVDDKIPMPTWFRVRNLGGAFMAVLIAIEIFVNIVSYLREDLIHVRIVLATALMAVARKVIILDYSPHRQYIYATAAVVAAMALYTG